MKQHRYRIQIDHLEDINGQPVSRSPLSFEVGNHDDVFHIVELIRAQRDFDPDTSTALAIGLKLFSEVMLENKDHLLFEEFRPHFVQFMKRLKSKRKAGPAA
ncbi:hypothetical protein ALQ33_02266 [Pseudomonas syringae pv. philadelphi]|uniref:DUF3861 domain-containing protein n=1 Tax=Pseudomonas syringae pv. philadelphi TaxID=251706 RepID=A0A3M3ZI93_9PSED|nr:DUF3861 domain-containing protein [Pseudomonas syringae group genomosp. 3]RMO93815.1 hypothetical protein ALQ33_02266 [Pseudomonas syringae pv. philadelphi]